MAYSIDVSWRYDGVLGASGFDDNLINHCPDCIVVHDIYEFDVIQPVDGCVCVSRHGYTRIKFRDESAYLEHLLKYG